MPTEAFEVIVSQPGEMSEQVAIASAAKYLAYSDITDTYGYHGDTFDINVYGGDEDQDWGIGICFAAKIPHNGELERFMDELEMLSSVESFERVHYERIES